MAIRGKFWLSNARNLIARSWNYVRGQRPTHFIFALWVITCVVGDYFGAVSFLDHQVISPMEFRVRRWFGKGPSISPRLKIYAFDDLAIKLLGEAYFPHELWAPLLEGINQARPSVILSAAQITFEKKGLSLADSRRIGNIPSLETPVFSSAFFSERLLPHHKSLLDHTILLPLPGMEKVPAYDYAHGYAYGPEGAFRTAFRDLGHLYQPWSDRFAPLVKVQSNRHIPHLALHGERDVRVEDGDLYLGGKHVPIDRYGLSLVNFLDPNLLVPHTKTIISLFSKINSGTIGEIIQPGDVVLIIGSFGTGASSFLGSPFGSIPNPYFLASIVNSVITGEWLTTYDLGWWFVSLSALLGYVLGWRLSTKLFLPTLLAVTIGTLVLDLFGFAFLSVKTLICMPILTLLSSSAIAFSARLKDEQLRKLATELEQKTSAVLQRDFLPPPQIATPSFELVCYYQAAEAVGGDWYAYDLVDERWLFMHVADVTGHGMPAALCASFAKGSIDAIQRTLGSFPDAEPPLHRFHERLNDILNREGSDRLLITLVSIVIDLVEGTLWYFNSGHPPGVVLDAGFQKVSQLRALGSPVLGLGSEFTAMSPGSLQLNAGDYVVLYTDGISPAMKKLIRDLSHSRTRKSQPKSHEQLKTPLALQDYLLRLNEERRSKDRQGSDDVTLVVLQYKARGVRQDGITAEVTEEAAG